MIMKVRPTPKKGKVAVELEAADESWLKPLPFQIQRILVPLDFSDTGRKALLYAVPFAAAFAAEVVLMHVVQPYTVSAELGYIPPELAVSQQELENQAREELELLCHREMSGDTLAQVKVCVGAPWQEIVVAAGEINADLIILSTHGRTGLKHVLLGSVTERVVRHAPCPVLVVRERERDFIPGKDAARMGGTR